MGVEDLELKLDSFDKKTRIEALKKLKEKTVSGEIKAENKGSFVNLHCHTFYSFNAYGYSPAHIAWKAYKQGLEAVGIVDFDVLDGVDEILEAGRILGIKTTAGIESRVFIKEYSDKVINSPGEPGVAYFMGCGFYKTPKQGSKSDKVLQKFGNIAKERNLARLKDINEVLKEYKIDYDKEVMPLTPKGNATERHILVAIYTKIQKAFNNDKKKLVVFWTEKLKVDEQKIASLIDNAPEFQMLIRSKIVTKSSSSGGSLKDVFPSLEEVIEMIYEVDALPVHTWLDGTNEGEKNIKSFLGLLIEKGVVALNIVPDRNWNIKDPKEKEIKVKNLNEVIAAANVLGLPLIAGTEMNKYGQKFVDDFSAPELSPYLEDFRNGAFFMYGHTRMAMLFDKGFNSDWAKKVLSDRIKRNNFYIKAGKIINPEKDYSKLKGKIKAGISVEECLKLIG